MLISAIRAERCPVPEKPDRPFFQNSIKFASDRHHRSSSSHGQVSSRSHALMLVISCCWTVLFNSFFYKNALHVFVMSATEKINTEPEPSTRVCKTCAKQKNTHSAADSSHVIEERGNSVVFKPQAVYSSDLSSLRHSTFLTRREISEEEV